jgi:hypothetical protein
MKGWEALTEDEKSSCPRPSMSRTRTTDLIRAIFEAADLLHQMKGPGSKRL